MKEHVKITFEFYTDEADELIQKTIDAKIYGNDCIGVTIEKNDVITEKRDFREGEGSISNFP